MTEMTSIVIGLFCRYIPFLGMVLCLLGLSAEVIPQKRDLVSRNSKNSRIALIIGNNGYESIPLRNPANDARLVSSSLREVGFETTVVQDLTLAEMKNAIRIFASKLSRGTVGLFYFSGHGVQIAGRNFLIPTDFNLLRPEVAKQSLEIDELFRIIGDKNGLNIIILDACRNAPDGFQLGEKQGLAEIRNAPIGTFIAFATSPGRTAADGSGMHSPYSQALASNLRMRPSRLEDVFIRTRIQVDSATGGQQTPWENSSIREPFYFSEDILGSTPLSIPDLPAAAGNLSGTSFAVPFFNSAGEQTRLIKKTVQTFVENRAGLELVRIEGGQFKMGTNGSELEKAYNDAKKRNDPLMNQIATEMPVHQVKVNGFYMGRYEITQAQWKNVMGDLPKNIPPEFLGPDLPIINVTWSQANDFCQKLSLLTQREYRLPTEAEWEYAAKAGNDWPFSFGESINSNVANFMATVPYLSGSKSEYRKTLVPVGSLRAFNAFGVADLHGNVWEWTADNWSEDYSDAPTDGSARQASGERHRVVRGGGWDSTGNNCRSAARRKLQKAVPLPTVGFRVVMQ